MLNRLSLRMKKKPADKRGAPPTPVQSESWTINDELAKVTVQGQLGTTEQASFEEITGDEKFDYTTTLYHLGIACGAFSDYRKEGSKDRKNLDSSKSTVAWVFFTENDLGKSLIKLLKNLMSDEYVKQADDGKDLYHIVSQQKESKEE